MSRRYVVVQVTSLKPYEEKEVFDSSTHDPAMAHVREHGGRVIDNHESRQWTPEGGWTPIRQRLQEKKSS